MTAPAALRKNATVPLSNIWVKNSPASAHPYSPRCRRRQLQYIGRLMREEADPQAVRGALDAIRLGHAGETASFKRSEKLRDDLMIATDAEMDALLAAFPAEDAAEIRGLTAKARNEREHSRPPHAYRALFRKLKSLQAEQ